MPHIDEVLAFALSQAGDRYVFGAEASASDSDPEAFDCSELVEWSCARAKVDPRMPDGSWNQVSHCRKYGTLLEVDHAVTVRGALLFKFSGDPFTGSRPKAAHVAFSLGDGRTMEARSSSAGVGIFSSAGRGWTHAGLVPGATYAPVEPVDPGPKFEPPSAVFVGDWAWGLAEGLVSTEFSDPHKTVTKEELVAILHRLET